MNFLLILSLITLSFLSSIASGKPLNVRLPYDRVVIFGDSTSDTGNFPAARSLPRGGPPPYNSNMPISNPVDADYFGKEFTVTNSETTWHYPTECFLERATSVEKSCADTDEKTNKSINWVEYFAYNALGNNSASEPELIPSSKIYQRAIPPSKFTSLNYAWAGALTTDGFANADYKSITNINNEKELYALPKNYHDGKISIEEVAIPGIRKQVDFYLHDIDSGLVPSDSNTVYLILVGGNDIGKAYEQKSMQTEQTIFNPQELSDKIANNVKAAVDQLRTIKAKNIYVLTYFDISNLPRVYHALSQIPIFRGNLKKEMSKNVKLFNDDLSDIFSKEKYKNDVEVLPVGEAINKLMQDSRFRDSVHNGQTCVNNAKNPFEATNCNYGDNQYYFAWNESHFITIVHQYLAQQILRDIQEHLESSTNVSDLTKQGQ